MESQTTTTSKDPSFFSFPSNKPHLGKRPRDDDKEEILPDTKKSKLLNNGNELTGELPSFLSFLAPQPQPAKRQREDDREEILPDTKKSKLLNNGNELTGELPSFLSFLAQPQPAKRQREDDSEDENRTAKRYKQSNEKSDESKPAPKRKRGNEPAKENRDFKKPRQDGLDYSRLGGTQYGEENGPFNYYAIVIDDRKHAVGFVGAGFVGPALNKSNLFNFIIQQECKNELCQVSITITLIPETLNRFSVEVCLDRTNSDSFPRQLEQKAVKTMFLEGASTMKYAYSKFCFHINCPKCRHHIAYSLHPYHDERWTFILEQGDSIPGSYDTAKPYQTWCFPEAEQRRRHIEEFKMEEIVGDLVAIGSASWGLKEAKVGAEEDGGMIVMRTAIKAAP